MTSNQQDRGGGGWVCLEGTVNDVRLAARSLRRSPGYALATITTLALGIGITTAIASYAWPMLFPKIPAPQADRVVIVGDAGVSAVDGRLPFPFFGFTSRFAFLRDSTATLESVGGIRQDSLNLVLDGDPAAVQVGWVTSEYFALAGATPAVGRLFLTDEFGATDVAIAVLSWPAWQKRFGGDSAVVGRTVLLDGKERHVVGILSKAFIPPAMFAAADVYLPSRPAVTDPFPPFSWMQVIGKLLPGVTREQAEVELNTLMPQAPIDSDKVRLTAIRDYYRANRVMILFIGAVAFLYAIASTNAANLMLARTLSRRRELGVRVALGGGRWRMIRLLLSESVLLCLLAAAGAYVISLGSVRVLVLMHDGAIAPGLLDWHLLSIVLGTGVVTGLVVVAAPAARIGRMRTNDVLKDGAGSLGDSRRLSRLRSALVVLQAALAVVLLVGAALTLKNFRRLANAELGFDPRHKLVVTGLLPQGLDGGNYLALAERFHEAIADLPSVRQVVYASSVPLSPATIGMKVKIDGRPELGEVDFSVTRVTGDYFEALGVPLVAGRGFRDTRPGDLPVVVINELAAKRFFPDGSALGRTIDFGQFGRWEIVGIVRDTHHFGPRDSIRPQLYAPLHQPPVMTSAICGLVQLEGPTPAGFEAMIRRAAYAADPRLVVRVQEMSQSLRDVLQSDRRNAVVFEVLSALALALAGTGLFSLMAYTVAQRQREFGVRAALGATRAHLIWSALHRGVRLSVIGTVVGLLAAFALSRFLQAALHEMSARDPFVYVLVALLLITTAGLACLLPARRAARANLMQLLRAE